MTQQASINDTKLSSSVTIAQYREFEREQNREAIANMIRERFTERYITPLRGDPNRKHGFSLMAISCLMIEAMHSFHEGWENSNGKSEKAFREFFGQHPEFALFAPHSKSFYSHVRCGILHQAETTGGWRVLRREALFDEQTRTINATLFHNALEICLNRYCTQLKTEPWEADIWDKCRKKLKAICRNCEYV